MIWSDDWSFGLQPMQEQYHIEYGTIPPLASRFSPSGRIFRGTASPPPPAKSPSGSLGRKDSGVIDSFPWTDNAVTAHSLASHSYMNTETCQAQHALLASTSAVYSPHALSASPACKESYVCLRSAGISAHVPNTMYGIWLLRNHLEIFSLKISISLALLNFE